MKNLPFHHNEKGSAILITLGILTLVLVLALVFVATSQNARTIAMAGADQGKADLLAESAAARAQAAAYYMQTISSQYPTNNGTNDLKYGTANGAALDALPYLGNFLSASNLDAKALDLTDNANRGIQTILYTHDPNNNNNVDASPYALMTSTQYGAYLLTGADGVNGLAKLDTTSDRWTYRNVLYQETINGTQVDLVKSRYAYLMLSEGGKFDINQMVLAGGTNVIPEVQSGSLAAPDDCNPTQFKDPANTPTYDSLNNLNNPPNSFENPNNSFFAIAGYKYNSDGEITGLNDIGGSDGDYDEQKTFQYGLHPQELRVPNNALSLANALDLNNSAAAPKWLNYDNMISEATPPTDFWHLFGLNGGTDDREVLYHGTEVDIEDCSSDSPKVNLAYPGQNAWDTISKDLNGASYLTAPTPGTVNNYLSNKFQDIFGKALHADTNSDELFKDGTTDITDQVFVNLVDFCDSDDFITYQATVGTDHLEFDTPSADFSNAIQVKSCGNEKTPAVIGVGLELTNCDRTATNGSGTWSVTGSGKTYYNLRVVLQNYFNDPVDLPAKVRVVIKGKINVWYAGYYNGGSGNVYQFHGCTHSVDLPSGYAPLHATPSTFDFSEDAKAFVIDQTFTPSAGQLAAREVDDTTIYDDTGTFELNLAAASGVPGKLERAGVWLQVTDVLVMTANSADELMDIAYADGNNHTVLWTKNAVRIVMPWSSYRPIAWAVARDPRCNHKDWQWFDALEPSGYNWTADATVGLATSVAFGMQDKLRKAALTYIENTCKNGNLSIAKDLEPLLDFTTGATGTGVVQTSKTFSTAFIPNHPITSLWQLGAVSRGVPGQTINLKKYGGPKGDLKYSDGDAWLLDYFKLNELDDKAPIRGKFNPNCFNEASYEFLFSNIPFNADPNETDVYEPGKLDDTTSPQLEYNEFYKDLIDGSTSATCHDIEGSGKVFDFNSSINLGKDQSWSPVEAFFNFVEIQSGSTGVNDRMAESLIGCTAGLLSTRYEYFTVFAVGQSVKWLGAEFDAMDNAHHNAIKDQIINPIQINNGTTNNWYSVLSTQMRLMTIERDCWFNTMRVVRTQLY